MNNNIKKWLTEKILILETKKDLLDSIEENFYKDENDPQKRHDDAAKFLDYLENKKIIDPKSYENKNHKNITNDFKKDKDKWKQHFDEFSATNKTDETDEIGKTDSNLSEQQSDIIIKFINSVENLKKISNKFNLEDAENFYETIEEESEEFKLKSFIKGLNSLDLNDFDKWWKDVSDEQQNIIMTFRSKFKKNKKGRDVENIIQKYLSDEYLGFFLKNDKNGIEKIMQKRKKRFNATAHIKDELQPTNTGEDTFDDLLNNYCKALSWNDVKNANIINEKNIKITFKNYGYKSGNEQSAQPSETKSESDGEQPQQEWSLKNKKVLYENETLVDIIIKRENLRNKNKLNEAGGLTDIAKTVASPFMDAFNTIYNPTSIFLKSIKEFGMSTYDFIILKKELAKKKMEDIKKKFEEQNKLLNEASDAIKEKISSCNDAYTEGLDDSYIYDSAYRIIIKDWDRMHQTNLKVNNKNIKSCEQTIKVIERLKERSPDEKMSTETAEIDKQSKGLRFFGMKKSEENNQTTNNQGIGNDKNNVGGLNNDDNDDEKDKKEEPSML